jgi:hypothetical protein
MTKVTVISDQVSSDVHDLIKRLTPEEFQMFLQNTMEASGEEFLSIKLFILPGDIKSYTLHLHSSGDL